MIYFAQSPNGVLVITLIVVERGDSSGDKRESRDPAGSVANEEARPRSARTRPHVTEISRFMHSLKYHERNVYVTFLYKSALNPLFRLDFYIRIL